MSPTRHVTMRLPRESRSCTSSRKPPSRRHLRLLAEEGAVRATDRREWYCWSCSVVGGGGWGHVQWLHAHNFPRGPRARRLDDVALPLDLMPQVCQCRAAAEVDLSPAFRECLRLVLSEVRVSPRKEPCKQKHRPQVRCTQKCRSMTLLAFAVPTG